MHWVALFLLFLNGLVMATQWVEAQRKSGHVQAIRQVANVPELMLLSELAGPADLRVLCTLFGPLEHKNEASELLAFFIEKGFDGSIHESSVQLAPEYWVYLPPFATKELALKEVKRLQAKGVDSYLISQGVLRNGISLGFFRNSDTANILLDRRVKQGYAAMLKEVPRARQDFWVMTDKKAIEVMQRDGNPAAIKKIPSREIFCK